MRKKGVEYRQTEYIMKVIIGGERLQLVGRLVFQEKFVIWGVLLN